MQQHDLHPAPGSRHKRKRVGRGLGSGHGTYSGRGMKGQKARSGDNIPPRFEGGQLPIVRRIPTKRGFFNPFRTEYSVVNVSSLNQFEPNTEVTPDTLVATGLVRSLKLPVKILANGEIDRPLTVKATKFSQAAKDKIEAAGGKTEEI
ncbi:MAG: 50S ribosomal protein L15 [Dehalococcoidia bacterium]|nr:50S ribosomal protein L15 [Dehalococcoidia bacterium]